MGDLERTLDEARHGQSSSADLLHDPNPFRERVQFAGSRNCTNTREMEQGWNDVSDRWHRQGIRTRRTLSGTPVETHSQPPPPELPFPQLSPIPSRAERMRAAQERARQEQNDQERECYKRRQSSYSSSASASANGSEFNEEYWKTHYYKDCIIQSLGLEVKQPTKLQRKEFDAESYVQLGDHYVERHRYLPAKEFISADRSSRSLLYSNIYNTNAINADMERLMHPDKPAGVVKSLMIKVTENIAEDLMVDGGPTSPYDSALCVISAFIDAVGEHIGVVSDRHLVDTWMRNVVAKVPILRELEILQRLTHYCGIMNVEIICESERKYLDQGMSKRVARARALYDHDYMGDTDASFVAWIMSEEKDTN